MIVYEEHEHKWSKYRNICDLINNNETFCEVLALVI